VYEPRAVAYDRPAVIAGANRPLGQPRGVGFAIVMAIVTFGLYSIYWIYKSFAEVKRYRGRGAGGIAGVLLVLVLVGTFLLPSYVGRMYREDGWEDPPISGWSGLWNLVPYIGGFIWIAKVQGALNRFWESAPRG
jgi:apolipoprotein N-acyltransferase